MNFKYKKSKQDDKLFIYGKHPVLEAIKNPNRKIKNIYCTKNSYNFLTENLKKEIIDALNIETMTPDKIDKVLNNKNSNITHQGIVLETIRLNQPAIEDLIDSELLVACDKITDPHNIGAIIRNSLAFGAEAIITDERNSPPENETIAKTSAGAIEKLPYIRGKSLNNTVEFFKKQGFNIVGLACDGNISLKELAENVRGQRVLLIVGSEGKGLSPNMLKLCDYVTKIEISEKIESLNASVASAIALFALYKD